MKLRGIVHYAQAQDKPIAAIYPANLIVSFPAKSICKEFTKIFAKTYNFYKDFLSLFATSDGKRVLNI